MPNERKAWGTTAGVTRTDRPGRGRSSQNPTPSGRLVYLTAAGAAAAATATGGRCVAGQAGRAGAATERDGGQQLHRIVGPTGQDAGARDSLIGRLTSKVAPQARQRYS